MNIVITLQIYKTSCVTFIAGDLRFVYKLYLTSSKNPK